MLGLAVACAGWFSVIAAIGPDDWRLRDRIGIALTGAFLAAVLTLLARPVARADREGVTVVNFLRKRRLEWAEILAVHLAPGAPWAVLDLADGTAFAVVAIQPGSGRAQARRCAAELRACVEAYGTALR